MTNAGALPNGSSASGLPFLAGGGETGARLRALDWEHHSLGSPAGWTQSLKTIVRMMLDSRYAMWMAWGPQLTFFCNDAYLPTVGLRRDWVLGARSDEVWREIWPDIGPRIQHVLTSGEATWDEGLLLYLERSGFSEETYHTFSYSPVYDDLSHIAGMLCVVTEVTERVVGERRLRVLRDLGAQALGVEDVAGSCRRAMDVLAQYAMDVPFSALYVVDADGAHASRTALTCPMPQEWFPQTIPLRPADSPRDPWRIGALSDTGQRQIIDDLTPLDVVTNVMSWPGHARRAIVLPLIGAGQERLVGLLIAGISPRRPFDEGYGSFFDLVAGQIGAAIVNAQAYEAERERAEALAEIDRAKTAFFSNVSHEFRTPLTLMLGPIEDLAIDPTLPEAARGRVELLHRNALRLLKLVNSLLEFSRIEAGRVQATYVPTDLTALTTDLVSTFRSAVELAGLRLVVNLQALADPVHVDRDMWEKVVLNLLSNAFKYTLQGEIEVSLRQRGDLAVLTVRDTGIGIPSEALPRLFERFYRVEGAQGRTHEGSGIGLALVSELVKLHGGTVSVESELNRGTTLSVNIPLGRSHLPPERVGAAESLHASVVAARPYVEEALRWLPDSSSTSDDAPLAMKMPRVPTPRDAHPRAAVYGSRVIVADDNSDMRDYLRELLESRYEIETVPDGQAAFEAAQRETPDLIVSDVMMPRMDGFELLRAVRADPRLQHVPTILLSARAGEEAVVEGLDAMADDYLVKPFSARELIARVGAQLQLARMRREAREALETADRQKNVFLAMLAHELRNPLAPLRNAGEILSRTLPTQSPGHTVVGMLRRQVAQLTRLVDDLLDVSRITQGRVELQCRPIELGSVVSQAIETAEPLFQAGQHEVSVLANSRALYVNGDMTRLVQCVVNILTNAAKYTDTRGKIRVETRAEGADAIITVTDTGVGIASELLPHVFDLFVQGTRTLDRSLGGLGIGLSVARRLIEMHGGRLTAASAGAGQGATFEIRLPRLARSQETVADKQEATVTPRRILIVDDNADAANSLALVLSLDGHVAEAVYSATEALSRASSFRPEVILLDIGLPEMDGYQVAHRLRQQPDLAGVRLVALTGYGQSDDVQRAREVGFDDHLTKPVDFTALARTLAV